MTIVRSIATALRKYVQFSGRARRREFWSLQLFILAGGLAIAVGGALTGLASPRLNPLGLVFWLATLPPSIACSIRRLHDIGRSGWWFLIYPVPVLGLFVLLLFYLEPGQPGRNRFGPDPKRPRRRRAAT